MELELDGLLVEVEYRVSPGLPATRFDPPEPAEILIEDIIVWGADDSPREETSAEWSRWEDRIRAACADAEATR